MNAIPKKKSVMVLLPAMVIALGVSHAFAGGCGSQSKDIVDTAVQAGNFTTLVTAVKAAGLADALKGDGPFTVFAPTDEAFAKLPSGTMQKLLDNPEQLKAILLYHVVPGKLMAADVVKRDSLTTLLGQLATINGNAI